MPSSLSENSKKGLTRHRNFRPAIQAVNTLVADLEKSENPEDDNIENNHFDQKPKSSPRHNNETMVKNSGYESTKDPTVSHKTLFRNHGILEDVDSKSDTDGSEDDSLEGRSKSRVLTEVERLEEVQTALEETIEETKELLQRRDRTRNQRQHAQQKLRRLELKLEKLEQRLELERAGRSRWTYVRRSLRKPRVGFNSSELLNRSWPSATFSLSDASPRASSTLADVILQEMERNRNTKDVESSQEPIKSLFKSKELQDLHVDLQQDQSAQERNIETGLRHGNEVEKTKDDQDGLHKLGRDEQIQDAMKREEEIDRNEMNKGWLRISERPEDFVKKINVLGTKQSKEAWVNINEPGISFAKKVFRSHVKGAQVLSRSSDGKGKALGHSGGKLNSQGKTSLKNMDESTPRSEKEKTGWTGSVSSSKSTRAKVVKTEDLTITTSFLPPIPKSYDKKRPRKELVEKAKDEQDAEQNEARVVLIPNRERVAKRRFRMYMRQLEFAKNHKMDQKEILTDMAHAIKDHGDVAVPELPKETTSRDTLYLIGALSKRHLRPPTAPPK